jgi:hypothetical protein
MQTPSATSVLIRGHAARMMEAFRSGGIKLNVLVAMESFSPMPAACLTAQLMLLMDEDERRQFSDALRHCADHPDWVRELQMKELAAETVRPKERSH